MLIVRRVYENDLDALFELILKSEYGLTTLKISKDALAARLEKSIFAFEQKNAKPDGLPYVFVMEDLSKGRDRRYVLDIFQSGWFRAAIQLSN